MTDTKTAILDAAEEGFAEKGIRGISLRAVLSGAGINPALAHYHFGDKQSLLKEILRRRMEPLGVERLRLLDELESRPGEPGYSLRELLHAFVAPAFELIDTAPHFASFLGQTHDTRDRDLRDCYGALLLESLHRYSSALKRVLPSDFPGSTRIVRSFFFLGLIGGTLRHQELLEQMAAGRFPVPKGEELVEEFVTFVEAGFLAGCPVPGKGE